MAGFTLYQSTDGSAPVLSGTNGSLVALLDACLVNGYGSKTAAGWTKVYTGTDKAAFQQASSGYLLRVQDDGPSAEVAKEAYITGYETMSDVDTGTNPFPNAAQGVGGAARVLARKSSSADAVARDWVILADARTVYVFIKADGSIYQSFAFGDFFSYLGAVDSYRCMIVGRATAGASANLERLDQLLTYVNAAATTGMFLARNYSGAGVSVTTGQVGDRSCAGTSTATVGILPQPNTPDGGIYLAPLRLVEVDTDVLRGHFRGLWHFCHPQAGVNNFDTLSGDSSGGLNGKTFLFLRSGNSGVFCIETSNTVDTN